MPSATKFTFLNLQKMDEELKMVFDELNEACNRAIDHAKVALGKLRAGKAMPGMLESVYVDYYGSSVPLNQVSNINTPDARTLVVQPWEKTLVPDIERAIINANLGLNPQNDGEVVIINIPTLTEERRTQLVKQVRHETEQAKIGLRSARRDANDYIKRLQKDGLSEDMAKTGEADVQKVIDQFTVTLDQLADTKEKEIMTI